MYSTGLRWELNKSVETAIYVSCTNGFFAWPALLFASTQINHILGVGLGLGLGLGLGFGLGFGLGLEAHQRKGENCTKLCRLATPTLFPWLNSYVSNVNISLSAFGEGVNNSLKKRSMSVKETAVNIQPVFILQRSALPWQVSIPLAGLPNTLFQTDKYGRLKPLYMYLAQTAFYMTHFAIS